ncbi:MAG: RidA family protein [Deltaproteobacteria bacterium]|nr:RidA family protein [Deltaproteobacteria bacterium]MBW2139157.1 RidA family protein [Deltaproteobacteria bacterium]
MGKTKKTFPLVYGGERQRFARSVVAGDFVLLSGCSGRTLETGEVSSEDVREQTKVALDKVRLALEEAGSSMENIVKVIIYFKDMKDYEIVKETELEYYKTHAPALTESPPASTVCQVVSLSKEDMLVEFDVTALRG